MYMQMSGHLVTKIVQYAPHALLDSIYLEEILGVNGDEPPRWKDLSADRLTGALLNCPSIEEGHVVKKWRGCLEVTYRLREPLFLIYGSEGLAIDEKGVIFPLSPFYTPRALPQLVLSRKETPLKDVQAACRIASLLGGEGVELVDFSFAEEVVVHLAGPSHHFMRLHPQNIENGIRRYQKILSSQYFTVADLRFQEIALLS